MSVPLACRMTALALLGCTPLFVTTAAWGAPDQAAEHPGLSWPRVAGLGLSVNHRPTDPGSPDDRWGVTPNVVVQWGRLTFSNGGTLASRAGEPVESGLTAELLTRDNIRVRAALRLDAGRNSSNIPRLAGMHDVPAHLRGRLQVSWRLHDRWETLAAWRMDLSGRGTGDSLELMLLHDWRPEFLDHRRWRVSAGVATQWRSGRQANLLHGVSDADALRTDYPIYRLDAGWTDARLFANWRRSLEGPWMLYGSVSAETLLGQAADSPLTIKPRAATFSLGVGRRF